MKKGFLCVRLCRSRSISLGDTVVMPGIQFCVYFVSLTENEDISLTPSPHPLGSLSLSFLPSFGAHIHRIKGRFQENVHQVLPYMNDAPLFGCTFH